jgi:hypothetical protein
MHQIIKISKQNLADHPQVICFINPKNKHHKLKMDWLEERFTEGLAIRLLQLGENKKIAGYIEYTPGEFAWRAVSAKDYMFIHCLWVYPNANKQKGYGSALLAEATADAKKMNLQGVAVIASDGSFMTKKELFLKNDFRIIEQKDGLQLLVKQFDKKKPAPAFNNTVEELAKLEGWHMIYTLQCPWVARFIEEVKPIIRQLGIRFEMKELTTARQAQMAPSVYATFSLVKDGRLLADRYISLTRFRNILAKEGQ